MRSDEGQHILASALLLLLLLLVVVCQAQHTLLLRTHCQLRLSAGSSTKEWQGAYGLQMRSCPTAPFNCLLLRLMFAGCCCHCCCV
jgi:hypothetical protein